MEEKTATYEQIKALGNGDISEGIRRWVEGEEPKRPEQPDGDSKQ